MKKVLAVLLALVLMLGLSTSVFAVVSPTASEKHVIVILIDDGTDPTKQTYEVKTDVIGEMEILNLVAHDPKDGGSFDGWEFFRKDGSLATIDSEYIIMDGNKLSIRIGVIPLSDLIIVAKYDGKEPDLTEAMKLFESESPQTGDWMTPVLALVLVTALGGAVLVKKQLAK